MTKKHCKLYISDQSESLELEIQKGAMGPDVIDIGDIII